METIGDEWIANLKGEHGKIEENILPYTETDGYAIKNRQDNGTSYYLYRERNSDSESINEDLLYVYKNFKANMGKVDVEKIFLSAKQEFIKITDRMIY